MLLLIAVVGGLAILIRVLAGSADEGRIAEYIQGRGGRVISVHWAPFGKGWFGEKNDRIYEVVYYDAEGKQHFATCKTSLFSGVYWTEDRVTHDKPDWLDRASPVDKASPAGRTQPPLIQGIEFVEEADLRDENRRLKQELARLKQELKSRDST